jgi:hypothetical protein
LSKLYSDKVKGAQIRSRIKWVEEVFVASLYSSILIGSGFFVS